MEYKKFNQVIVARIDKGEEILTEIEHIAKLEKIKLANINALGAVGDFTVGVFKTKEKQYDSNSFQGDYEIVSLTGTINTMNGEFYSHLHMSAGDETGKVVVIVVFVTVKQLYVLPRHYGEAVACEPPV